MLYVARRAPRKGLLLEKNGLLVPLSKKMGASQLDEILHIQLEKQGVNQADHARIVAEAEAAYEKRQKVEEAGKEVRRLMALRAEGKSLMQYGHRKWKEVWYPARPRKGARSG